MELRNGKKPNKVKETLINIKDWILNHSKIVMPIVLVVCVGITVLIAISVSNRPDPEDIVVEEVTATEEEEVSTEIPVYPLEENAYPDVINIVRTYYDAEASGDLDTIADLNSYINEIEKIRIQELSKYIDSYADLNVYTKPGMTEGSYVAYVCAKAKFYDIDALLPGMQTYYIGKGEDGKFFMNDGTYDETINEYVKTITLQADVVELNNRVTVEYNELLTGNEDVNNFVALLKEKINEEVGIILAASEAEGEETTAPEESAEGNNNTATVINKVRVIERVNIRKSDSADADKLGSASVGEEYKVIQKKPNGWTEIEYNGESAFIKSMYLEDVETTTVEIGDGNDGNTENTTDNNAQNNTVTTDGKTVTVNDSGVRIRKEANTTSDVLGTVYVGEKLELVAKEGEWTKVKYKGKTGYIKSTYVD